MFEGGEFFRFFEHQFVTLECGVWGSNRFDFWYQRSRISLEPNFEQNRRKLRINYVWDTLKAG